jgi:lysozyme
MVRILPLLSSLAALASAALNGIDVSSYQGTINWASVKAAGIQFVSTKATEGVTYTDPTLRENWAGLEREGITRCAYHFAHPSISAVDQAHYFVNAVEAVGGYKNSSTLQFMLDLEDADGLSPAAVWEWVQSFMSTLQTLTGRPGIIYTGYYFWRDNVGNPTNNLNAPLWIAAYDAKPLIPSAWKYYTFWQYDDNGRITGINGNVDVDYLEGDAAQLEELCFP